MHVIDTRTSLSLPHKENYVTLRIAMHERTRSSMKSHYGEFINFILVNCTDSSDRSNALVAPADRRVFGDVTSTILWFGLVVVYQEDQCRLGRHRRIISGTHQRCHSNRRALLCRFVSCGKVALTCFAVVQATCRSIDHKHVGLILVMIFVRQIISRRSKLVNS